MSGNKEINTPSSAQALHSDGSNLVTDSASTMIKANPSNASTKFVINEDYWPRFWICKPTNKDNPLSKLKIFAIQKAIHGMIGEVKDMKPMGRTGLLFIEVDRYSHVLNMMKTKSLANIPVEFNPHRTLNSSQGVVFCYQLDEVSEEEILEELGPQGVIEVYRMKTKRQGKLVPLNTYILTFNTTTVPEKINVGYLRLPVRPYVPNPRRCYNCQRFGHGSKTCKKLKTCAKCGQETDEHDFEQCPNDEHCINCKGNHSASSKECPEWNKNKKILTVKADRNITFYEAKAIVEAEGQTPLKTYSNVVASDKSLLQSQNDQIKKLMLENKSLKQENSTLKNEITTIKKNLMDLRLAFSELQKNSTVHSVVTITEKTSDSDVMDYTDGNSKRSRSSSEEEEIVASCEKGSITKKGKSSHEDKVVSGVVSGITVSDPLINKHSNNDSSESNDGADGFITQRSRKNKNNVVPPFEDKDEHRVRSRSRSRSPTKTPPKQGRKPYDKISFKDGPQLPQYKS